MPALKTYPKLPIHIVEDHNDALNPILQSIAKKYLPFNNNLMIHFDSHPDLLLPRPLTKKEVFDKKTLIDKVSIENWILPTVFAGHFSTIVWIKPFWSNQIGDGLYQFGVGIEKSSNEIRVSSHHPYFIGDLLFCDQDSMEEVKNIDLYVMTLPDGSVVSTYASIIKVLKELIAKYQGRYVLDIDLDYFSTSNPFIAMLNPVDGYDRLKPLYEFKMDTECSSILENQDRRRKQLESMENVFEKLCKIGNHVEIRKQLADLLKPIENDKHREILRSLILDLIDCVAKNVVDYDWMMVHDAGCTYDTEETILPHHVSTTEEIDRYVACACALLRNLPLPVFVTIARSSSDDYCPPDQVDMLQEKMCQFFLSRCQTQVNLLYSSEEE